MSLFETLFGGRQEEKVADASALTWTELLGFPSSKTGVSVTWQTALRVSVVWACCRVLCEDVGKVPLKLMRSNPDGSTEICRTHPLHRVLSRNPNEWQTSMEWRMTQLLHALLARGGYSWINRSSEGEVLELIPLMPQFVIPKRDRNWNITYEVRDIDGTIAILPRESVHVLHGLSWDGLNGLDVTYQGGEAIGLSIATEETQARLHGQGTRPGGVITTTSKLDDKQIDRLKLQFANNYSGVANAFKTLLLDNGLEFKPWAMSGVDAQHLECVVPGTLVSMADGTRLPVEALRVGDRVVGWADGPVAARVAAIGRPPTKDLVRVTTARGRTITCSSDHPFLSMKSLRTPGSRPVKSPPEWVKAGEIGPGQYVRVGLGHVAADCATLDSDVAWFLGAMVGNGYIRGGGCSLSTIDPGVIAKAEAVVRSQGGWLKQSNSRPQDFFIATGGKGTSRRGGALRQLFNRAGLVGSHSHTKRVPDMVMAAGPTAWRAFLSGYLDTDGTIGKVKGKAPLVSWGSTSRALLDDSQHLLASLGVQSAIYKVGAGGRRMVCGQECDTQPSWQLVVYGASQLAQLARLLSPAHSEKASRLVEVGSHPPSRYGQNNVLFDRVLSVERLGRGETIGVEIEGIHTHVTNGLVTHNTRRHQVEEVCRFFRVFPAMVGFSDKATTYASADAFLNAHVTHSLMPWITLWEQAIDRDLLTSDEIENGFHSKFVMQGLLRGDAKSRALFYESAITKGCWMTRNEARRLEDLDPIDGLDDMLRPLNMQAEADGPPAPGDPADPADPTADDPTVPDPGAE
jgi:phage portal protein BeeE